MPLGETPRSVQKLRFSAAITASWVFLGTWSSGTEMRFWAWKEPRMFLPSL